MATVPMLLYHQVGAMPPDVRHEEIYVTRSQFVDHLTMLQRLRRSVIPLSRYLAYRRGDATLPACPVVITFDDGYRSTLDVAAPILEHFRMPATVFLVSRRLGGTNAWDPAEPQVPLLAVSELRAMQASGTFEFGSHTATHARLPLLSPAVLAGELSESRESLEQILGQPVSAIAYPWGATNDTVMTAAAEAGYQAGLIVRRRANFDATPAFALRRIAVYRSHSRRRLAWDLLRLRFRGE